MAKQFATAIFEARSSGGQRAAREMRQAARGIRRVMFEQMQLSQEQLTDVFRDFAPYDEFEDMDTIHLRDELEARLSFPRGRIRITVHSPVRGAGGATWAPYPYTGVTRFGHRGVIRPRLRRRLRWVRGGVTYFRSRSAGYHPVRDWVDEAKPEADRVSERIAERVGRVVYTRLLA